MARYTGPKNRICRAHGINFFGRLQNPLLKKPNPPGQHAGKKRKKSDFGVQLQEQQKLKAMYGMISQKQLVSYYKKAASKKANTADLFMQLLECRLDTVVYRLKLAPTLFSAQQLVSHGHIQVDGKKVNVRSFQVRPGMTVSIKTKSHELPLVKQAADVSGREVPEYLASEAEKFSGKLLSLPHKDQIPLPAPINVAGVIEFIAHNN